MKTKSYILYYISIALMLLKITSCTNDNFIDEEVPDSSGWHSAPAKFLVTCNDFDSNGIATRGASSYSWKEGDVIYLLLTDKNGNEVPAYVKYDSSKKAWGEVMYEGYKNLLICEEERSVRAYYIDGISDVSNTNVSLTSSNAIYICTNGTYEYPADGDMTVNVLLQPLTGRIRFHGDVSKTATINGVKIYTGFSRTTGKFTESTADVNLTVASTSYTPYLYCSFVDESTPSLTVTTDKTYKTVFDNSSKVLMVGKSGFLDLPSSESHRGWMPLLPVSNVTLNKTSVILDKGTTEILTATVSPENAIDCNVTWTSSDTSVATVDNSGKVTAVAFGTSTITVTSVSDANKWSTCTVNVIDANGHAFVDLGLTSGLLWATMNVGAVLESDYGNYYAWGETRTKGTYTLSNYSYLGNPTTLPFPVDVARANWEGCWRMPTQGEFEELYSECTWTWTRRNEHNGYLVKSKKNNNSMFLPAAGLFGSSLIVDDNDPTGFYWSSTLDSSFDSCAYRFLIKSRQIITSSTHFRYYGLSVRPVIEK